MEAEAQHEPKISRLEETIRRVREREDNSKIDFAQAKREALASFREEISDVIQDIPYDAHFFDFRISGKEPARLWIDATTFVTMGYDTSNYRMLKETRAGRILLCESDDRETVAEAIVHYIAERLAEWERSKDLLDQTDKIKQHPKTGTAMPEEAAKDTPLFLAATEDAAHVKSATVIKAASLEDEAIENRVADNENTEVQPIVVVKPSPVRNFLWFLNGLLIGAGGLFAYAWFREEVDTFVIQLLERF